MNNEIVHYIIAYFPHLLTEDERMALRHQMYLYKLESYNKTDGKMEQLYREKGLITNDPAVLALIKDGAEQFEWTAANRILREHPDKVFLNTCAVCGQLARTPQAKQCRCGHSWR